MGWTTPDTFAYKEVLSSAKLNQQLRDNLLAILPNGPSFQSWTPTLTNTTLGSGSTVSGKYIQFAKLVYAHLLVLLGTGGDFSAQPTFTLPIASVNYPGQSPVIGHGGIIDGATSDYPCAVWWSSTTVALPIVIASNDVTNIDRFTNVTSTVPINFDAADGFQVNLLYMVP